MKRKIVRGIWFFGMSGSGKSYISSALSKKKKNSVIVDGDDVRKYISIDLGYDKKSRIVQINRIFGICKIIIKSEKFPIASSVYFNNDLKNKCKKIGIIPIKVLRKNFVEIIKSHKTYKNKKDIVGLDIDYEKFKTLEITNCNNKKFIENYKFFKSIK